MSEQVLKDKIALVTGASRGIGKAVAKALAEQGATVVGTATTEQGAEGITAELEAFGGRGVVLNVTDNAACDELLAELAAEGGPHILVNNAGITRDNLAMRMKDEEWLDVMQTNLNAVFRLGRGGMRPMMKAREGRIINLTSVIASVGNPGQSNYAAAKAAVAGMSRSLASELGSRNITVNCVAPGFIDTDMTRSLSEEVTDSLLSRIPLSRFGQPEDIANAVVFLASPQASYITGTTLHVNGGMFMQ